MVNVKISPNMLFSTNKEKERTIRKRNLYFLMFSLCYINMTRKYNDFNSCQKVHKLIISDIIIL